MTAIASMPPAVKPDEALGDPDDLCPDDFEENAWEGDGARNGSRTRRLRKVILQSRLRDFLEAHGFEHVNECRRHLRGRSNVYPIHIAAEMANATIVRLLLQEGSDAHLIFRGRTACQIAEEMNHEGSHDGVIALLKGGLKFLSAQALLAQADQPEASGSGETIDLQPAKPGSFQFRGVKTALLSLRPISLSL